MEKERVESSLKNRLSVYGASDYYGFHMPGHKRRMGELGDPYKIDITEIYGFDDLHHPEKEGIITRAQERAARLYGAEETHFLVNGSTAGILSAISGCTHLGSGFLMARNSHRSVYHGAELRNLKPWYLYPQTVDSLGINGGILSSDVENSLREHEGTEAVFLTSPTYEGICTDVKAIAEICHSYRVPLIVDQAHGAHFPFSEYFPMDALKAGADVVIQSIHKTLPALTQTALLHIQGKLVDRERIRYYLSVYQSSSPSYVLMASIDNCMEELERQGGILFEAYIRRLERFRNSCDDLKSLQLLDGEFPGEAAICDYDKSRLVICTGNTSLTGEMRMKILRSQYHLEMEMASENYVIGISSVADQKEDFMRLSMALHKLDEIRSQKRQQKEFRESREAQWLGKAETAMAIGTAMERETEWVEANKASGRIAGKYIYLYPPGIPLTVPGERVSEELCAQIKSIFEAGQRIHGLDKDGRISVIR